MIRYTYAIKARQSHTIIIRVTYKLVELNKKNSFNYIVHLRSRIVWLTVIHNNMNCYKSYFHSQNINIFYIVLYLLLCLAETFLVFTISVLTVRQRSAVYTPRFD